MLVAGQIAPPELVFSKRQIPELPVNSETNILGVTILSSGTDSAKLTFNVLSTDDSVVMGKVSYRTDSYREATLYYSSGPRPGTANLFIIATNQAFLTTTEVFTVQVYDVSKTECIYEYSPWSTCDVQCGQGKQMRTCTTVSDSSPPAPPCVSAPFSEYRACATIPCRIPQLQSISSQQFPAFSQDTTRELYLEPTYPLDYFSVLAWSNKVDLVQVSGVSGSNPITLRYVIQANQSGTAVVYLRISSELGYDDQSFQVRVSPLDRDCVQSWGEWSSCSPMCGPSRSRSRSQVH